MHGECAMCRVIRMLKHIGFSFMAEFLFAFRHALLMEVFPGPPLVVVHQLVKYQRFFDRIMQHVEVGTEQQLAVRKAGSGTSLVASPACEYFRRDEFYRWQLA